eukprot:scaffold7041_cov311-Pinguiococcus_pyrenoidosus.AAC.3
MAIADALRAHPKGRNAALLRGALEKHGLPGAIASEAQQHAMSCCVRPSCPEGRDKVGRRAICRHRAVAHAHDGQSVPLRRLVQLCRQRRQHPGAMCLVGKLGTEGIALQAGSSEVWAAVLLVRIGAGGPLDRLGHRHGVVPKVERHRVDDHRPHLRQSCVTQLLPIGICP